MASYTTVTTNENSDHCARFRSGTDVPYHSVSIDTIFHMQSKTLVHSAELSSSLFSNGAPNDTYKNSPGQCNPNFPIRCADNSKKK